MNRDGSRKAARGNIDDRVGVGDDCARVDVVSATVDWNIGRRIGFFDVGLSDRRIGRRLDDRGAHGAIIRLVEFGNVVERIDDNVNVSHIGGRYDVFEGT